MGGSFGRLFVLSAITVLSTVGDSGGVFGILASEEPSASAAYIKSVVLCDGEYTCFHRIRESTRNEYVAVGSNGDILRWSASGGQEQKWLLAPVKGDLINIITLQNGEYMSVLWTGDIWRWQKSTEPVAPDQTFRFLNYAGGKYNIQEQTKGEYVAVGSNGNVLRWSRTGGDDQRFALEPIEVIQPNLGKKSTLIALEKGGVLASLPPPDDSNITETERPKLLGVETLASVLVTDPTFSDKLAQVNTNPYYFLTHRASWKHVKEVIVEAGSAWSEQVEYYYGASRSQTSSVRRTFSFLVGASQGGDLGLEPGESGGLACKVTQEMSSQFKFEWEWQESSQTEESYYLKITETRSVPVSDRTRHMYLWQPVHEYTLYNYNLKSISTYSFLERGLHLS
ncbi:hypothetical protein Pelo_3810 [Pelomyxa schiedti]|nr:hypothetical protein Pelo_3810 [Pelomyxa schiedti]